MRPSRAEPRRNISRHSGRQTLSSRHTYTNWLQGFPGRPILSGFVRQHLNGKLSYEGFVNLILDAMVENDYKPPGMTKVLAEVVPNP
jgi:hypothetical protein